MVGDLGENLLHSLGGIGADLDNGRAGIVPRLADGDVGDAKLAAARGYGIEDLGKDQAIDDMARNFDFFGDWIG